MAIYAHCMPEIVYSCASPASWHRRCPFHAGSQASGRLKPHPASSCLPTQSNPLTPTAPPARTAVLLVNLGTPEAPDKAALRPYLKQFLSDPRVVEIPRPVWWLILNGIILNTRPAKSAEKYAAIWTPEGSPLKVHTERQTKLAARLSRSGRAWTGRRRIRDALRPAVGGVGARAAQGAELRAHSRRAALSAVRGEHDCQRLRCRRRPLHAQPQPAGIAFRAQLPRP